MFGSVQKSLPIELTYVTSLGKKAKEVHAPEVLMRDFIPGLVGPVSCKKERLTDHFTLLSVGGLCVMVRTGIEV